MAEERAAVGQAAPAIVGTTLDGSAFDLASVAGKPVVVNFWGPSCVPCRDEFPLLQAKVAEHAADGLTIVGVLTDDPLEPARAFVDEFGGTWQTVVDPDRRSRRPIGWRRGRRRTSSTVPGSSRRSRSASSPMPTSSGQFAKISVVSPGAGAGDPAVVVEGLVKRYGGRAVVDGVSLQVAAGELVALLGPNGAGKTTTVEIVEGYRSADGGRGPGARRRPGARRARRCVPASG